MSDVPADPFRPSFFELYASEQLRSLLGPALRYIVVVLAQRRAGILLRLANKFDEAYALALFLVERHYLKTWGASFSENFYSLKRRRRPGVLSANSHQTRSAQLKHEQLRSREINLSLLFLVGVPYLTAKAHSAWERMGGGLPGDEVLFGDNEEDEDEDGSGAASSQGPTAVSTTNRKERVQAKLKDLFCKGYPYAQVGYQGWLLLYHLAYLFDRTPHWRPWLKWMRIDIRRLGPEDYEQLSAPLLPPGGWTELLSLVRRPREGLRRALRASPHMFFESLKYLLPAAIFGFKFLEWWYSSESPRRRTGGDGTEGGLGGGGRSIESGGFGSDVPLFGPPKPLMPDDSGVLYEPKDGFVAPVVKAVPGAGVHEKDTAEKPLVHPQALARAGHHSATLLYNACGLCGRTPIANPALLRTGYAFCYSCALSHLEDEDLCPISKNIARMPGEEPRDAVRRVLT